MAAIKSRGNKSTELKLIAIFREYGITGWRRHQKLRGCPDFVFRHERLAVFVDGCFWHGCKHHLRIPASRRIYWKAKINRNVARDISTTRALKQQGWDVLRIWEHSLNNPNEIVRRVTQFRLRNRAIAKTSPHRH
jgi:DNA mismatch endonuclease (patch repair protein)